MTTMTCQRTTEGAAREARRRGPPSSSINKEVTKILSLLSPEKVEKVGLHQITRFWHQGYNFGYVHFCRRMSRSRTSLLGRKLLSPLERKWRKLGGRALLEELFLRSRALI